MPSMSLREAVDHRDHEALAALVEAASPELRREALMAALALADASAVTSLLRHPCAVDTVVRNDFPLAAAVRSGEPGLVGLVLDAGANINLQCSCWWERSRDEGQELCKDGVSALLEAIRYDHGQILARLIARGAAPNQLTTRLRTPFELAEELGHCVRELRAYGGRRRRPEDLDLLQAGQLGAIERLRQLLDSPLPELERALNNAALNNHPEAVRFLASKGVQIRGCGPLDAKARYLHLPTLEALLDAGADPNARALSNGELALGAACDAGQLVAVEVLLAHGARVDATDIAGLPALHFALAGAHLDIVEALLIAGADPLVADGLVRHSIHKLAPEPRTAALELLGAHVATEVYAQLATPPGAETPDPTAPKPRGDVRMMAAKARGDAELQALIRAGRSDYRALTKAVGAGADPGTRDAEGRWWVDDDGRTLLHLSAQAGAPDLVRRCLNVGIPADLEDAHGASPLHGARTAEVVERLVAAGAKPNAVDRHGSAPLHHCYDGPATAALLRAGADPYAPDASGEPPWMRQLDDHRLSVLRAYAEADVDFERTPTPALHRAAERDQVTVIETLLACGVDALGRDADGDLAADRARKANQLRALRLLVEFEADPGAEARVLAIEPKTVSITELLAGLEPEPLREDTLAALRERGDLCGLLAEGIESGDVEPYLAAIRDRWCAPWPMATAFREYVIATLDYETLGPGPWSLLGIARAQLATGSAGQVLGASLAAHEFPGVRLGAAGEDHGFWLLAAELDYGQRGGAVLTASDRDRLAAAAELAGYWDHVEDSSDHPAHHVLDRLAGLSLLMSLDVVDLLFLFRVLQTGEVAKDTALFATLRWDPARRDAARRARALNFGPWAD